MEKEVTDQVIDTVDMEEEKKDMEKVVLKVNYETEDEKKGKVEPTTEGSSPKPETVDTGAASVGHICSPSIESCPSPATLTLTVSEEKLTANGEEKETEDAESGSSMSTLSLPSRSLSCHHH